MLKKKALWATDNKVQRKSTNRNGSYFENIGGVNWVRTNDLYDVNVTL